MYEAHYPHTEGNPLVGFGQISSPTLLQVLPPKSATHTRIILDDLITGGGGEPIIMPFFSLTKKRGGAEGRSWWEQSPPAQRRGGGLFRRSRNALMP